MMVKDRADRIKEGFDFSSVSGRMASSITGNDGAGKAKGYDAPYRKEVINGYCEALLEGWENTEDGGYDFVFTITRGNYKRHNNVEAYHIDTGEDDINKAALEAMRRWSEPRNIDDNFFDDFD